MPPKRLAFTNTFFLATLLLLLSVICINCAKGQATAECSRLEYDRCVRIADPLLREASLVFPDNPRDIEIVCRTWTAFVDCLKLYTDRCFTDQQRRQFNKAVETPIESVHQMCLQPQYQKEYLQYAPCIKATIVDRNRCGPHYSLLVDQVAQGEIISKATLCCSHDRFKQCVNRETRRSCDHPDSQMGPAAIFSTQILDKALSFLQDQCFNYIPNSGDCTSVSTSDMSIFGYQQTTSMDYPSSAVASAKEQQPQMPRMATPKHAFRASSSSTSWMPERADEANYQTDSSTTQLLGSRTRPASYGRSGSTQIGANTVQRSTKIVPDDQQSVTVVPDWMATRSTASASGFTNYEPGIVDSSTETWYPAAGNQLSNEVDEPNQQGLRYSSNSRNSARGVYSFSWNLFAFGFTIFCALFATT